MGGLPEALGSQRLSLYLYWTAQVVYKGSSGLGFRILSSSFWGRKKDSLFLKTVFSINEFRGLTTPCIFLSSDTLLSGFSTGTQLSLMHKHYLSCITSHALFSASCMLIFLKRKHAVRFVQGTVAK